MEHVNVIYEKDDACYGKVTCCCRTGAFLVLDNGQEAFAYKFASLQPGTEVLCCVERVPVDDRRMLVSIESVLWDDWAA